MLPTSPGGSLALDMPQSVTLREGADGYLGRVAVGRVDADPMPQFSRTLMELPVPSPSSSSNPSEPMCHRWVADALAALREDGHFVEKHVTKQWLVEKMGK